MRYYTEKAEDVLKALGSTADGLSEEEAHRRLAENGPNKLDEGKKTTFIKRFFDQLKDPMIIILIVAAIISAVISVVENEPPTDVFIILFVVLLNAILGVIQESKAEKAIDALKEMTASTSKVLRGGKLMTVKSEELVIGDVCVLEAGDAVPADARLIEAESLKCEEAALTGESVPCDKTADVLTAGSGGDIALGDRADMVYMGGSVAYGRGKAVVCAVGMDTEMGRIAGALSDISEEKTPLQVKLAGLSRVLTKVVLAICAVIFAIGIIRALVSGNGISFSGVILPSFMVSVSLAVAAIPEGLSAVVTIVLSIGVTKMSRRSAVIRKLTAVEALGCTQVICSDKTGTLTQNKMTVTETFTCDDPLLAKAMSLCSDAVPDDTGAAIGEPTECALVNHATKLGLDKNALEKDAPRVSEIPFDSSRKMMSTFHKESEGYIQYTKGAPDELLKRCSSVLTENGVAPMDDRHRADIASHNKAMADKALRVLGAAYKKLGSLPEKPDSESCENDLVFIGLCGMIDPVRPEVAKAVAECKAAGIRPIMITGDHRDTAAAIAKELGIIKNSDEAITGEELNRMTDEELFRSIEKYSVYARVRPEHKVRIVSAWKKKGKITAMTGDGVNDAPSIKAADIGIGMGITGTDVTKNVADMVLGDDNFATIVVAVEEGRKIYDNIRKAIQFLLSSNMSEVITIFAAEMIGFTVLRAPHLLWINLLTDCFPALALGMEPGEKDVMVHKPRSEKAGIFAGGMGFDIIYQGLLVSLITLAAYYIGSVIEHGAFSFTAESNHGVTMAFLAMSMAEIFHSVNMRSLRGSVFTLKGKNLFLLGAMVLALALTTAVIEIPALAGIFGFTVIGITEYAIALGLSVLVIPIVEITKFFQRKFSKED